MDQFVAQVVRVPTARADHQPDGPGVVRRIAAESERPFACLGSAEDHPRNLLDDANLGFDEAHSLQLQRGGLGYASGIVCADIAGVALHACPLRSQHTQRFDERPRCERCYEYHQAEKWLDKARERGVWAASEPFEQSSIATKGAPCLIISDSAS
jgi:hypothetical protein